ncbi:hypothetical protein [Streptomyces acidiscabies]|uniref:hypothetical protein n=1 Tax=Streptomyces acidiscabies TaxID=42234 RepID=UPI00073EC43F|nr:hypothetical protein [Streptomyces acidiscabies]GAQ51930.1 hypothetical protein a10_01710 [Streptomyces acidiscabies]
MADEMTFWDYSRSQVLSRYNGSVIGVRELPELCRVRADAESVDARFPSPEQIAGAHPLALTKPRRWEAAVGAAVYAGSGQVPVREEVIKGRELLDRLPRSDRATLTVPRMLALVPALIAGFRLSRQAEGFNPEANRYVDGARFLSMLLEDRPSLDVEIGLCAHRAGVSDPTLPAHVSLTGAQRMTAFVSALLDNSLARRRTVDVTQQTATDRASATVNSLVLMRYAAEGRIEHLLRVLDQHAEDMRTVLERHSALSATRFRFTPLDPLSDLVEQDMTEAFGPDWSGAAAVARWRPGTVLDAAVEASQGTMTRFLREETFDLEQALKLHAASDTPTERGAAALRWFARHEERPLLARARYHVALAHRMALSTLGRNGIGIGMERGWYAYQWLAWSAAYEGGPMPLLYARSSTEPPSPVSLRSFGLRQFW